MKELRFFLFLLVLIYGCSPTHTFFADAKMQNYRMQAATDSIKSDTATARIENMISPFRQGMAKQMNEVVGVAARELTYGSTQSLMGNWACDAILSQTYNFFGKKADFVANNQGGFRIRSIPKGDVTVGKIFELMPFDNQIVLVEVSGEVVKKFCDYLSVRNGWPVAGIKFEIVDKKFSKNIIINGEPLDLNKKYLVGVSDYVVNGGDKCDFFKSLPQTNNAVLLRDIILAGARAQTKAGKQLDAQLDDRIVIK